MINLYNEVPLIYSNTSRDFQYLSWLINIVLNDVKHNIDSMYDLPNIKTDTRLVELLALTLGFKIKRNYDQKQLIALVSIIPSLLKYKGTITAIIMAANALIKSSGATGRFDYEISNNNVVLLFPKELVDISLFNDLLPYILPAGMTCRIIRDTQTETDSTTQIGTLESIKFDWVNDISWDEEHQTTAGLSGLFDSINSSVPNFANFDSNTNVNAGLLSNTIIPVLEKHINMKSSKPIEELINEDSSKEEDEIVSDTEN